MVVYTSLLWDALGPGTIMAHSCTGITLFTYTGTAVPVLIATEVPL